MTALGRMLVIVFVGVFAFSAGEASAVGDKISAHLLAVVAVVFGLGHCWTVLATTAIDRAQRRRLRMYGDELAAERRLRAAALQSAAEDRRQRDEALAGVQHYLADIDRLTARLGEVVTDAS